MAQRLWPRISLTEWELGPRGKATPRRVPAARFGPVYKHTTTMLQLSLNTVFALQVNWWKVKVQGQKLSGFLETCASHKAFSSALWLIGRDLQLTNICDLLFYGTVHFSSAYLLEENCSWFFSNRSLTLKISLKFLDRLTCLFLCHRFFILKWSHVVMKFTNLAYLCRLKS